MPNLVLAESRESAQYDQEHELPPSIPPKTITQLSMQEDLPPNIIMSVNDNNYNNNYTIIMAIIYPTYNTSCIGQGGNLFS